MGSRAVIFTRFQVLICLIFSAAVCFAADVKLPPAVKSGDLFVLTINPDKSVDKVLSVKFSGKHLQFMGAVQGTPDLQILNEQALEIKPEGNALADVYELKFLVLLASGSSEIQFSDAAGQKTIAVNVVVQQAERGYSWIILLAGTVLLVVGIKMWRYQKSSPEMMSTKSLFMNYEELEKARKMYFPDETSEKSAPEGHASEAPSKPEEKKSEPPVADKPPAVDAEKPAGNKTVRKMPSLQPLNPALQAAAEKPEKDVEELRKPQESDKADLPPEIPETSETIDNISIAENDDKHDVPQEPIVPPLPAKTVSREKVNAVDDSEKPTVPVKSIGLKPSVKPREEVEEKKPVAVATKLVFAMEARSGNKVFEGSGVVVRIGRKKDNQIVITASEVSREHAEVLLEKGKVMIRALTETNITRLNERSVKTPVSIKPGDLLNLGGTEYVVTRARPA